MFDDLTAHARTNVCYSKLITFYGLRISGARHSQSKIVLVRKYRYRKKKSMNSMHKFN